jgi:hypothetical protein
VTRFEERNSAVADGAVDAIPTRVTSAEAKRASATTVALVDAPRIVELGIGLVSSSESNGRDDDTVDRDSRVGVG